MDVYWPWCLGQEAELVEVVEDCVDEEAAENLPTENRAHCCHQVGRSTLSSVKNIMAVIAQIQRLGVLDDMKYMCLWYSDKACGTYERLVGRGCSPGT